MFFYIFIGNFVQLKTDKINKKATCYHCGEQCIEETIIFDDKKFCCQGCKTVFEILNQNDLCNYYNIENAPGITPPKKLNHKYDYLEDKQVIDKLIDFSDNNISIITFYLPQIHCSSCIWLLENLYKLNDSIQSSRVNFLKKEAKISFNHNSLNLRQLVELLVSIGYEPQINLNSLDNNKPSKIQRALIYKLGVAGFCFGNIMLISLPEYFGLDSIEESSFSQFFGYINFLLALPVFLYSSTDYFKSAFKGIKQKFINIDIPIALGILVLFLRSSYEVFTKTGAGYFDSLAGLIFFLLLGKIFQQKTYNILSFERDYKSYFPVAVTKINLNNTETSTTVANLNVGDVILIRNDELIPVDVVLLSDKANIDNSFVTGESAPVKKIKGEKIYAGGKQIGKAIRLKVIKKLTQSYLTQLWNDDAFTKQKADKFENITNSISKYFTIAILLIAIFSGVYWIPKSLNTAINAITSVLIIACPCALALSAPFTLGNVLRILGRNKFYLKNTTVIETLSKINNIVFDKTGTITQTKTNKISYVGEPYSKEQEEHLYALFRQSSHPLSKTIYNNLPQKNIKEIVDYKETIGKGIEAKIEGISYKVGGASFTNMPNKNSNNYTAVHVAINNKYYGCFKIGNAYRTNLKATITKLKNYSLSIISGDNDSEKKNLLNFFNTSTTFLFNQSPNDKLNYIKSLQKKGANVLMIGDGLNDAGALKQSNVGISISEDVNTFSPACDAILDATVFSKLPVFINYCKSSINIIIISFIISFLYNIIGLSFAVQGKLSPVFAAVLMPLSSITVVVFVTLATNILAKHKKL